jgi:hypothetical protein
MNFMRLSFMKAAHVADDWYREQEIRGMIAQSSRLESEIKCGGKVDELSWIAVEFSNVDRRCGRAITEL